MQLLITFQRIGYGRFSSKAPLSYLGSRQLSTQEEVVDYVNPMRSRYADGNMTSAAGTMNLMQSSCPAAI